MIDELDISEFDEADDVDVPMHKWAVVLAPQLIGTSGLGPCIGIAAMNDTGGTAGVLHSPNMNHGEGGLRAFLETVIYHYSDGDCLRVVLTGGEASAPEYGAEVEADRQFTLRLVEELLPNAVTRTAWAQCEEFLLEHHGGSWLDTLGSAFFSY